MSHRSLAEGSSVRERGIALDRCDLFTVRAEKDLRCTERGARAFDSRSPRLEDGPKFLEYLGYPIVWNARKHVMDDMTVMASATQSRFGLRPWIFP